jgi:hypothetical protein
MTDLLAALVKETPRKRWLRKHLDHQDQEFCLIWPFSRAQNGYAQVGGARVVPTRVMCEHRNGPPPTPEHQAAHSCGNGHNGCVNPWHLNWKTVAENQLERYEHQGGPMPRYRLRPEQVDQIRALKGRERTVDTAARFQCTEANIRQIQSGKTWQLGKPGIRQFTAEEVALIRATPWQEKTARQWAAQFGVKRSTIDRIRGGVTYRYFDSATPTLKQTSHNRATAQGE